MKREKYSSPLVELIEVDASVLTESYELPPIIPEEDDTELPVIPA